MSSAILYMEEEGKGAMGGHEKQLWTLEMRLYIYTHFSGYNYT